MEGTLIRKYGLYITDFSTDFSLVKVEAAWKRLWIIN